MYETRGIPRGETLRVRGVDYLDDEWRVADTEEDIICMEKLKLDYPYKFSCKED